MRVRCNQEHPETKYTQQIQKDSFGNHTLDLLAKIRFMATLHLPSTQLTGWTDGSEMEANQVHP